MVIFHSYVNVYQRVRDYWLCCATPQLLLELMRLSHLLELLLMTLLLQAGERSGFDFISGFEGKIYRKPWFSP